MKELPKLYDFLKMKGVNASTPKKEVEALKKKYWKVYHGLYYRRRKKEGKRFTMRLTNEEYQRFKIQIANHQQMNLSGFIKTSALAYLEERYIPRDQGKVEELNKAIRKIGNTINQVVQQIHRTAKYERFNGAVTDATIEHIKSKYELLVKRVYELQKTLELFMTSPPGKLEAVRAELLQQEPGKIALLRNILDEVEAKNQSHARH